MKLDYDGIKERVKQEIQCTEYLQKSKGHHYCCPVCGSGTHGANSDGALYFYQGENTWHCFSCGAGGDVIDLYQRVKSVDYKTAMRDLASRCGIDINLGSAVPSSAPGPKKEIQEQEQEKNMMDYADYYRECRARLHESKDALAYLSARGISEDLAQSFGIGFDPAADPAGAGHPARRIIIPVTRTHYVGRCIDQNNPYPKIGPKGARPGIFNQKCLYDPDVDVVFITEGVFDAMSICAVGSYAIAINSTSNTNLLLNQIDKKPVDVDFIVALDNDGNENTKAAIAKLVDGLKKCGCNCIEANVSCNSKDPNDALVADRDAFINAIECAKDDLQKVILENDPLTDFWYKIQTEAYRPHETGLHFFDDLIGGGVLQQSLILLMAAPGTGKTTLCQQIGEEMAAKGQQVIYLNLEMSREQMFAKAISSRLARKGFRIPATNVLQGYQWNDNEYDAIEAEIQDYQQTAHKNIAYNPDDVGSDLGEILDYLKRRGERAKRLGKQAPAVILDYLHLISTKENMDSQELIKQAVVGLKDYARQYDTFVILIVATNRESNKNGRITMSSGRDSSNIEYTGDYQISLNYYDVEKEPSILDNPERLAEIQREPWRRMILRVLKGRFCMPGKSANVYFNAACNLFADEVDRILLSGGTPVDDGAMPFPKDTSIENSSSGKKWEKGPAR